MAKKIAIIGAGPIGVESALIALERGYEVTLIERGDVGNAILKWGHVRMFSPFEMNTSARGLKRLQDIGKPLPEPTALLSGREYVEEYLAPLATTFQDLIRTQTKVFALGRIGILKGEKIGDREEIDTPFRLLLRKENQEWAEYADLILDCSGTFFTPNYLGDGGMQALGESQCQEFISYGIPDVTNRNRDLFAGKRVLVLGSGHSAATVIRDLALLKENIPSTSIIWATRNTNASPCRRVENDSLLEREHLLKTANNIAHSAAIDFRPGRTILLLSKNNNNLQVTLSNCESKETIEVDRIIASVGFRPDLELTRELQVKTCYATEGTYNLAAMLLGENGGDCLAVGSFGVETLLHPEPGYFALGIKSYGRSPDFLIRTGGEQIESLFNWLEKKI